MLIVLKLAYYKWGERMILENQLCSIEIKIDVTYTIDSADNASYDMVYNPNEFKRGDFYKTFSILINRDSESYRIALIGDYFIYDIDCAILEGDILTILQNDSIIQLKTTDRSIKLYKKIDTCGVNLGIYRITTGYILYGEIEIIMLDLDFNVKWRFSGQDIFASLSGKNTFTICEHFIRLIDFKDNYYEVDFSGKLLNQGKMY